MKKQNFRFLRALAAFAITAASCSFDAQPAWMKKPAETTVSFNFGSSGPDMQDSRALVQGKGYFYILTVGGPAGDSGPFYGPFEVQTGTEFKTTAIPAGSYTGFMLIHSARQLDETFKFTVAGSTLTFREFITREDISTSFLTMNSETGEGTGTGGGTGTGYPLAEVAAQFFNFFAGEASIGLIQSVSIEKGKDNVLSCTLRPVPSMEYLVVPDNCLTSTLPGTTEQLRKFVSIYGSLPEPPNNILKLSLSLPAGTNAASLGQVVLYGENGTKLAVLASGTTLSSKDSPSVEYQYQQKTDEPLFLYVEYVGSLTVSACYDRTDGSTLNVLNRLDASLPESQEEIKTVWDAFAAQNPSITVERQDQNELYYDALLAAGIELKQLPDVVFVDRSKWHVPLHSAGLLKDLGPLLEKDGLTSAYNKELLEKNKLGYLGVIPSGSVNTHVMYVNKRVLDACGLSPAANLDELKAQVSVLASKGKKTLLMANAETWVMQSTLFSDIAARFCGLDWLVKIKSGSKNFTDSDFVSALSLVGSLYSSGILGKETLSTNYDNTQAPFLNDEYAYYIDGAWRINAIAPNQTDTQQADILLAVFPKISDAVPAITSASVADHGWGISAAVPAGSEREKAAWTLIKWLQGKTVQEWRVKTGQTLIPSFTAVDASSLGLSPIHTSLLDFRSKYASSATVIDSVLNGDVVNAINDNLQKIGLGETTPEAAAAAIQTAWTTITP